MIRFLQATANLIGSVVALLILGFVGFGVWEVYQRLNHGAVLEKKVNELQQELQNRDQKIADLERKNNELAREVERLRAANRLLKVDTRVGILDVVGQEGSRETQNLRTTVVFREVDSAGRAISPQYTLTIDGDVLYVDAWVAKFQDEFVELGDAIRGGSLSLFRRLFGEHQKPSEGLALDPEGDLPGVYRHGREVSEFEREIWKNFWELANNPKEAEKKGLRAIHGEAVYMKLVPGMRYRIQLRSSDGLSIVPEGQFLPLDGRAG